MEVEEIGVAENNKEDEEVNMPGFRFHPTDEELVGFYLRRKVEGKPFSIELIKQLDIYKYEPWDLAKLSNVGDKEWYFYCIRGRKYKNSIRPNRVTGCGFWKATGIDKPISSNEETDQYCIGLKKSLVFYRGSAGKGTKTDWMMHEFRLPPSWKNSKNIMIQEAEVWTLCRIFKRTTKSHKKCTQDHSKQITIIKHGRFTDASSKTCSFESENSDQYMTIKDMMVQRKETKALVNHGDEGSHFHVDDDQVSVAQSSVALSNYSSFWNSNGNQVLGDGTWDELRSEFGVVFDPANRVTWS